MLDTRITKLLLKYAKVRKVNSSVEMKILEIKYNNVFQEVKYLFQEMFTLGVENYEAEVNCTLHKIEEKEQVIIAILSEMVELSEK